MKSADDRPKTDRMNGAFDTLSEAEAAFSFSRWLGTVFLYLLFLGKKPFKDLQTQHYKTLGLIIGYLLNLGVVAAFLIWLWQTR